MKVRFVALCLLTALGLASVPASGAVLRDGTPARRLVDPGTAGIPAVWERLAVCETGGDWTFHNSTYQGGLGFYYGSWDAYRPRGYPSGAHLASPVQQVAVGKRIRADVGWSAWPACSLRLGLR